MRFEKYSICPELKRNLEDIGFLRTTDIQFKTIPAILNGEDVLAIAQTGTGKTAAFAIPIIEQIHALKLNTRAKGLKCIVLVPTRELSKQIGQVFAKLSRHTKVRSFAIYGGTEQDPQIEQLIGGVEILIATPGRMFDLIHQGHIDPSTVEILVLDEADHMLDLGFIEDIKSIKRKLLQKHQTLFFSATINSKIKKLAYSQINAKALRIQVSPENMVSRNISHFIMRVPLDDKRHLLVNLLNENPQAKCLIFARTKVRVERVHAHLQKNSIDGFCIHGGMDQMAREHSLESFRENKSRILIATDVSSRGIDLSGITLVINYDLPDEVENYVHRVGRTGRGFEKGDAISFCSVEEDEKLAAIEKFLEKEIPELKADDLFMKSVSKDEIESLDVSEIIDLVDSEFEQESRKGKKKNKR